MSFTYNETGLEKVILDTLHRAYKVPLVLLVPQVYWTHWSNRSQGVQGAQVLRALVICRCTGPQGDTGATGPQGDDGLTGPHRFQVYWS